MGRIVYFEGFATYYKDSGKEDRGVGEGEKECCQGTEEDQFVVDDDKEGAGER